MVDAKNNAGASDDESPVVIKKYANRRLYNTASSSYVTLDHLCLMVKEGDDFVVYDAKTGEDITRSVLTQIIVEEEAKGQNLLPINFLRQLIRFYGDNLQMVVPGYLEQAMTTFSENQEQTRTYMQEALGGIFPFNQFEDMGKQNMAMFEQAMNMFNPMAQNQAGKPQTPPPSQPQPEQAAPAATADDAGINALKEQVDLLQKQLETLTKKDQS